MESIKSREVYRYAMICFRFRNEAMHASVLTVAHVHSMGLIVGVQVCERAACFLLEAEIPK